MPSNYPSILFGTLPLLEGSPDSSRNSNSFQRFESQLFCERGPALLRIRSQSIPCMTEHYVNESDPAPIENALAQCSETFKVKHEDGKHFVCNGEGFFKVIRFLKAYTCKFLVFPVM